MSIRTEVLTLKDNQTVKQPNNNDDTNNSNDNPPISITHNSNERVDSENDDKTIQPTEAEETENKLKKIIKDKGTTYVVLIFALVISFVILILACVFLNYIGKPLGTIIVIHSCITFLTLSLSFGVSYFYFKKIDAILTIPFDITKANTLEQSWQHILLVICTFLTMLCVVFELIFSVGVLSFKDDIKLYIKGLAYNADKWKDNFGDNKYIDVMSRMNKYVNCIGSFGIIFFGYIIVVVYCFLGLFKESTREQVISQFKCMLYVLFGLICMYLDIYAFYAQNIIYKGQSILKWLPIVMIVFVSITIINGVICFILSYCERCNCFQKKLYDIAFFFTFAVLVIAIFGAVFVSKLDTYKNASCNKMFMRLHERFLEEECGCNSKYVHVQTDLNSLEKTCPKDRVVFAWENEKNDNVDEKVYGCINQNCCFNMYSKVKSKLDYLVLFAFGLFVAGLAMIDVNKDEGVHDKTTGMVMGVEGAIVIASVIVVMCLIPGRSDEASVINMKVDSVPKTYARVNETLVVPQSKEVVERELLFKVREELKHTQITIAPQPEQQQEYTYTIELSNSDIEGSFKTTQWTSGVTTNSNDNLLYTFKSKDDYTNTFSEYVTFVPSCPLTPNVFASFTITNGINTQIGSTQIDFSQVNASSPVELKVRVKYGSECTLTISPKLFTNECGNIYSEPLSTPSNTEAQLVVVASKLYTLKTSSPIEYTLTLTPLNTNVYEPYETTFIIGGIGFTNKIDLGEITLVKIETISTQPQRTVKGIALNAIDNSILNYVQITVYKSMFDITSDMLNTERDIKELLLSKGKELVIDTFKSDDNGEFAFKLHPGTYTIVYNKDNFYFNLYSFELKGNESNDMELPLIALVPEVEQGEMRVVLTWMDGPSDVDIHSMFKVTKKQRCHVYFGNKECVGVEMEEDNIKGGRNGVETITINTLGKYVYTFYVHKYVDSTNGNADGEERTKSFMPDKNEYKDEINGMRLCESKAKVDVYGVGYSAPIATFKVGIAQCDMEEQKEYKYWMLFCLNGSEGVSSLKGINELMEDAPSYTYCEDYYN